MKIKIIIVAFFGMFGSLLSASNSLLEYEEPIALCIGNIVFPLEVDPQLCCLYYKGDKLEPDTHHDKKPKKLGQVAPQKELVKIVPYTLSEVKATQRFHLLICSHPYFASDSNTIKYIHVPENVAYKFYTLSGARQYNKDNEVDGCLWSVTQESLLDDRVVPDNTVIFLFNADYIEGLDVKSWPLNSNIRLLPSIIVKKTIDHQDVLRAIIEGRLLGIDFDTLHGRHPKNSSKIEKKTVVMMKSV
ncbi:MAG: hypothetical protein JO129_03370 [Candidatus Dependentiae bacterium]|nr:hypothetical protein [Candidatus Dependentiae bacterium]